MVDQLSLRLDPDLPRLPTSLRPMLAVPTAEPFDSPEFLFEPAWGGRRVLAFFDPPSTVLRTDDHWRSAAVRMVDEHGLDLVQRAPELEGVRNHLAAASAVLDGELVVVDRSGRADALALASRLRGNPGPPLIFLAFDIVHVNGRPLLAAPLARRREMLRRVLRAGEAALAVPGTVGEGRALNAAASEAGLAGVTARLRRSPYLPGVRSRMWRFIPGRASAAARDIDDRTLTKVDGMPGPPAPPDADHDRTPMIALIRSLPLDSD